MTLTELQLQEEFAKNPSYKELYGSFENFRTARLAQEQATLRQSNVFNPKLKPYADSSGENSIMPYAQERVLDYKRKMLGAAQIYEQSKEWSSETQEKYRQLALKYDGTESNYGKGLVARAENDVTEMRIYEDVARGSLENRVRSYGRVIMYTT
jgi:hypothetical protein